MTKFSSPLSDLIFLLLLNLAIYGLAAVLGLFEQLEQWRHLSASSLLIEDRLLLSLVVASLSGAVFAWRRWGDLGREMVEHKQTRATWIESETRFRQMMEHLEDVVYLSDANGSTLYVNSAYEKFTGRSSESLYEQPLSWLDWIHPDDAPGVWETITGFHETIDLEYRVIRPDGSISWVRDRSFAIPDESGQVYRYCGITQDVTARKQVEETLREREQFIEGIIATMPNLVFIYNLAEQRLTFSNHSLAEVLGYNEVKEQILDPQVLLGYLHPEDVERYQAHLDELQWGQPGEILTIEYRLCEKDGGWRWFQSHDTVFKRDRAGLPLEVLGIARDITPRKVTEAVLQQERAYLRQVIDAVPAFIAVKNMTGRYVLANQALAEAYGTTVEHLVGKTDADFNPNREEVDFFLANDQETLASGQVQFIPEEMITYADGQIHWLSTHKLPLFDRQGQPAQVLLVSTDITERKQMEADLRASQAQYQSVVEHIKEVIFQTDATGLWTFLNPAWTEITGFTLAESLGQNFLDFIHPDDRQRNLELFQPLIERQKEYCRHQIRYRVKENAGRRQQGEGFCWIEVHARLTLDAEGNITGTSGTLRDVTEVRRAEAALQQLNAELEDRVQRRTGELSQMNEQLSQEISERRWAEQALQERVEVEKLFAALSTRFINLTATEIDREINLALQAISTFAGVDRVGVLLLSYDHRTVRLTYEWCTLGVEPQLGRLPEIPLVEWAGWREKLEQGETIHIPRVADLPLETAAEKAFLQSQAIQSVVMIPLLSQGQAIGLLGFDSIKSEKIWPEDDLTLLQMFGEILVNALQRQRADAEIQQRNRELILLNRITEVSMSAADPEGMLALACHELASLFNLAHVQVVLFNEAKTEATVAAEAFRSNGQSRLHQVLPVKEVPLLQQILTQKSPLTPESSGFSWGQFQMGDLLDAEKVRTGMALPLGMSGDIVGVLTVGTNEPRVFSLPDFGLLWSVADQISVALNRMHLAQNQQRLAAVIEQITEGVVITNSAGDIVYVNPAFERMTGYTSGEVLGQNPRLLKSGKTDPAVYTQLWDTVTQGHPWRGRLVNQKKDRTLYTCDSTITPVFDDAHQIVNFVAIKRDVSQTLQLEEQYRQAQKMESVGRLASGVAHDFNNILTAIIGYTGLSLRTLPEDSPIRADLQGIEASANRAANLTRQLLAFARKQVIEPRLFNLNELISGTSKILRRLISANIELVILPAADLGWTKADPGQLEQVLFNLVVNAHDAMPGGGKLILETANVTLTPTEAQRYAGITPGEYVLLSVTDTGMGMDDEIKAHIFEPFFTTKAPGKGTGLGLATCFGIVKQSDGHIWVESELNQGTTFKIFLPRSTDGIDETPARKGAAPLPRGNETILLVEDEPLARDTTARSLRLLGYTVVEAENGEEALREMDKRGKGKVQLLITDLVMPQMGGKALVETLKPVYLDLKILLISGYTDEVISKLYLSKMGAVFLQKPFSPATLAYRVRKLLDQR